MMEGQVNQDNSPLPDGWHKHFDQQRKNWYYVNINTSPPQITYTHPLGPNIPYSPPSHYGEPRGQAPARAAVASQGVPQHHAPRYQEQAPYPSNPAASSIPGAPQSVSQYSNYETSNAQFPATNSAPYYSNPVYGEHSAYGYRQATESPSQHFPSPGYAGSYQALPPKSNSVPEARMSPPNFPHYPTSVHEESPGRTHSSKPIKTPDHAVGVSLSYPAHGAPSSGARDPNSAGSAASKIPSAPGYGGSSSQDAKSPVHMSSNSPQYPSLAYEGQTAASKAPSRTTPSIPEFTQYPAPSYGEAPGQTTTKSAKSYVQPVPQYAESSGSHGQKQSKASSPSMLPYASPSGQNRDSQPKKSPTQAAAAPPFPHYPAPGYGETHEQKVVKPSTQPTTPEFPQYPAPEYGNAPAQKATTQSAGPSFPLYPPSGSGESPGKTVDQKPATNTSVTTSFPQYSISGYDGTSEPARGQKAAKSPKTTSPTPNISQSSGYAASDSPQYPAPGYESSNQVSKPAKSPAQTSNASPVYPSSGHAEYSGLNGQAHAEPNGSPSPMPASQFPHYPAPSYGEPPRQAEGQKLAPSAPSFPQFPEYNDYHALAGQSNAPKPSKSPPQPSSGSLNMPQYPATGYEQQSSAPKPVKSPPQPSSGSPNMPQYPTGGYELPPAQFQTPPPANSPSQAYPLTPAPSGLTMAQKLYSSSAKNMMSSPSTNFSHFPAQQDLSPIHNNPSNNSNDFNMPTAVAMSPQSQDYYANPAAQKPLHNSSAFGSHSSNSDHMAFPSTHQTHQNYFESKPLPNEPLHRAQSYQAPALPAPAQDFYHHRASTFTASAKSNTITNTKPKPTPHLSMTARPPSQAHGTTHPQISMFPGSMVPGSSGPLSPTLNQLPGQNAINSTMGYSSPPLPYASPTQFSPQAMYVTHPYQVPTYQPQAVQGQVPVARGFEENYNSTKKAIKKISKKVLTKSNGETALKIANGVLFATTGIPAGLITSLGSALASHVIDNDTVNSIISSLTNDSDNGGNEDGSQLQSILQSLQSQPAADTGGVDYQAIVTALVQQYQQQAQGQKQAQQQQAPPPTPAPVDYAALLAQFQANSISPPQQVAAPAQAQTFDYGAAQDANAMATLQMQQAMMEQQMMLQCVASSGAMGQI